MSKFKFNEKSHRYTLDGKPLTGVTTIIGVLDKPALVSWSANCAVDYIESRIHEVDIDELKNVVLPEARKAWAKKRDKAGDIGTRVHALIEEYVKGKIANEEIALQFESDQERAMFNKFLEWEKEHEVKFLLSEQRVYSEKHWYAGTVDLVVEIKGKKYIADIKTAKSIYNTNYIQMAGYHIALEELGKVKDMEGYIVLNIPKELNADGTAKFREKRVKNYKDFQDAFLHCLALYRFINKIK